MCKHIWHPVLYVVVFTVLYSAHCCSNRSRNIEVQMIDRLEYLSEQTRSPGGALDWADMVVSAGGDGTFLLAASRIHSSSKPLIGFNTDPLRSEVCANQHSILMMSSSVTLEIFSVIWFCSRDISVCTSGTVAISVLRWICYFRVNFVGSCARAFAWPCLASTPVSSCTVPCFIWWVGWSRDSDNQANCSCLMMQQWEYLWLSKEALTTCCVGIVVLNWSKLMSRNCYPRLLKTGRTKKATQCSPMLIHWSILFSVFCWIPQLRFNGTMEQSNELKAPADNFWATVCVTRTNTQTAATIRRICRPTFQQFKGLRFFLASFFRQASFACAWPGEVSAWGRVLRCLWHSSLNITELLVREQLSRSSLSSYVLAQTGAAVA